MPTKQRFTNQGNQQSHTDTVVVFNNCKKKSTLFDDLCMAPDNLSIQGQVMTS